MCHHSQVAARQPLNTDQIIVLDIILMGTRIRALQIPWFAVGYSAEFNRKSVQFKKHTSNILSKSSCVRQG